MNPQLIEIIATVLFAVAVMHTFSAKAFTRLASRYPDGSIHENLFHLLGEVEVVFGLWASVLMGAMYWFVGYVDAVRYLDGLDFTEPAFVFVIMAVSATRPVIQVANSLISGVARLVPLPKEAAFIFSALVIGPLLGSFITEPAAMTVTAIILKERLFEVSGLDKRVKYLALGTLFVNISIGGVLTPYAAPPVLMVAKTWEWDFVFMMNHFGYKAALAVLVNASLFLALGWKSLHNLKPAKKNIGSRRVPFWLVAVNLFLLAMVVVNSHHIPVFAGFFLLFLAVATVTQEYQDKLSLKESLLVGSFFGGLVVLGGLQSWWLSPLLSRMSEVALFLGCTALTAVTDNAALTFLGAQVEGLSEAMEYALVAGAVAGGGLTVIANAPNPAGYSILHRSFGKAGVSPLWLLLGAALPTLIAMIAFWFLPHLSI